MGIDTNISAGRINGLIFSYGKVHAILLGELFKITDTLFVDLIWPLYKLSH